MTEPLLCPCCGQPLQDRPDVRALGDSMPLGPIERRIFEVFAAALGKYVDNARLVNIVYSNDIDGGPLTARNSISVNLSYLRRKIRPYGLVIEPVQRGKSLGSRRMTWTDEPVAPKRRRR